MSKQIKTVVRKERGELLPRQKVFEKKKKPKKPVENYSFRARDS